MANLARILVDSAARYPERPALRLGDLVVTYAELDAASRRVAGLLREHGVAPGDRVAIMLPNVPEFASAYYGALRLRRDRAADERAQQAARGRVPAAPRRARS